MKEFTKLSNYLIIFWYCLVNVLCFEPHFFLFYGNTISLMKLRSIKKMHHDEGCCNPNLTKIKNIGKTSLFRAYMHFASKCSLMTEYHSMVTRKNIQRKHYRTEKWEVMKIGLRPREQQLGQKENGDWRTVHVSIFHMGG